MLERVAPFASPIPSRVPSPLWEINKSSSSSYAFMRTSFCPSPSISLSLSAGPAAGREGGIRPPPFNQWLASHARIRTLSLSSSLPSFPSPSLRGAAHRAFEKRRMEIRRLEWECKAGPTDRRDRVSANSYRRMRRGQADADGRRRRRRRPVHSVT